MAIKKDIYDNLDRIDPLKDGIEYLLGSTGILGGVLKGLMGDLYDKVALGMEIN